MSGKSGNRFFSNLLQGSLLTLLLLGASYVTIGRTLIANVDNYRADVKELLATRLGVPVQISKLEGGWAYLNPSLEITGLGVGLNSEIRLEKLAFSLDAIGSLKEATPVFREVRAEGVRLQVFKQDEAWRVAGLIPSGEPVNLDLIIKSADYLVDLELHDIAVAVQGVNSGFVLRSEPGRIGELRRTGEVLSLALPLEVDANGVSEGLYLAGQIERTSGEMGGHGHFYGRLPGTNISEFLPANLISSLEINELKIGGELWIDLTGEYFQLQGKTELGASFADINRNLSSNQVFAAEGHLAGEVVATIAELEGEFAGVDWQFNDIGLSLEPGPAGNQLSVQIPELSIEELLSTPLELGRRGIGLSDGQVQTLSALNPTGQLSSFMAIVHFGEVLDYRVVGELNSVSVERYQALPVISDLNGMLQIRPGGGFLDMINERPFTLQFPGLFDHEWYFDNAKTRVTYEITDEGIQAQTGLVEATWGELIANGRVQLKLPGPRLETTWALELGVQNANLLDAFRYLPNTLKEDVRSWMERSILAGRSIESGMLFHGSLAKEAPKDQKAHQLYFEVEDSILDYDAAWPRFDELMATIFLDNFEISSRDARGRMFDSDVYDATVMVPISTDGVADSILIDGKVRGAFSDGVRVLTETPLVEATSNMAVGWRAQGEMSGSAKLNLPIGPRAERGEPTWAEVTVDLAGADLTMANFDLDFTDIQGQLKYESNSALSSAGFTARLFEQNVLGTIASTGDASAGEIIVTIDGRVAATDLYRWSGQPLLSRAEGELSYQSDLHVFYGERSDEPIYVNAESDLTGVTIHMPAPLGKSADEIANLKYRQTFIGDNYRIGLELADWVKAQLEVIDGFLAGGELHFGSQQLKDVSYEKLRVTGEMDYVKYEEWDALSTDLAEISEGSLEEELEQTLDHVTLQIGLFDVFGFEMDKVLTKITRDPGVWQVDLSNDWLQGRVSVEDEVGTPLKIAMQRLSFESDAESPETDPLFDVDPSELTLALFSVEQLLLDGEDYGRWGFLYEPVTNGALLKDMNVSVRGLQVAEDAAVQWQVVDGRHTSEFKGAVSVPDLGLALREWGYASSIEGQDFSLFGDVSWSGSPAMVDLEVIEGLIKVVEGEGRFVQADSNMGALRLLGIFDFASLAKRFRLDFSDVVDTGFTFDKVEGETRFSTGIIDVVEPIKIEGSGSTFKVAGRIDLDSLELDSDMVVTLPLQRNLPWYAAYSAFATGPLTGAGVFLVQQLFQNQINAISSAKYKISGTMDEPIIEFVTFFSDSVREAPAIEPTGP